MNTEKHKIIEKFKIYIGGITADSFMKGCIQTVLTCNVISPLHRFKIKVREIENDKFQVCSNLEFFNEEYNEWESPVTVENSVSLAVKSLVGMILEKNKEKHMLNENNFRFTNFF